MNDHQNRIRIAAINERLGDLKDKVVYVGGATISLYADRETSEIRPTDDVDVIVEILNYTERAKLEEKLRAIGFQDDVESGISCRFRIQGIIVDVMPTADESIGFKNIWYPEGFKNAVSYSLDENNTVKILSPPYFIATKLEAFKGRGRRDGRTSHDFEDIVYVLENRKTIWEELNSTSGLIKEYLIKEFKELQSVSNFAEWIDCHVEYNTPSASKYILEQIKKLVVGE